MGPVPRTLWRPPRPADTMSARAAPTAKAAPHTAHYGVGAQVVWGKNPHAHLGNASTYAGARAPPFLTPFGWAAVGACASGSGLGWGGAPTTRRSSRVTRVWGSPPLGAADRTECTSVGRGGGAVSEGAVGKVAASYPLQMMVEEEEVVLTMAAAVDLSYASVGEEEYRYKVQDLAGFSRE